MNEDLLNILSHSNKNIDNQKLMDYLSHKLSKEQEHEFEMEMAESGLLNDAVEGLESIQDKRKIQEFAEKINADLQRRLTTKRNRKQKRALKDNPWVYLAIFLILLLIIISYFVIHKYLSAP